MRVIQVTLLLCVLLYQVLGETTTNDAVSTPPHQLISQASNRFTFDMYNVVKEGDDNLFVSPFSMKVLLALLYLGSKGAVLNEIQTALHLPNNECVIKEGFKELIAKAENSAALEIATRMFGAIDFKIKDKFLADAQTYFYSGIDSLDFANKPEEAVSTINSFVAEKTHDKIQKLFDSLPPDTVLVLVNALYFKADWKYAFPSSYQQLFFMTKENSVNVDMMTRTEDFNYKHDSAFGAQILELPYKDDEYSMIVVLPDEVDGLHSVENKLTTANFETIVDGMYRTKVIVNFPKFKMEKDIKLNSILQKLGLSTLFVPGAADLSGISDGPLYVSEAIQKTYIKVDENGTEAAAVTAIVVGITSVGIDRNVYFTADHPFVFMIINKVTNTIFFQGRFCKPE